MLLLIRLRARIALLLLTLCIGFAAPAFAQAEVKTENVRATLLALAPQGTAAGKPLWLGLRLEHRPKWHTYWKNPGDTGLPTTMEWTLPPGVTAGEIDWPAPHRMPIPPLLNYGYEGIVLLPVPVVIGAAHEGGPIVVTLTANWLVCEVQCIPETGTFAITIPAAGTASAQGDFDAAFAARPTAIAGAKGGMKIAGDRLIVSVSGLPAAAANKVVHFFPEQAALIDHAAPIESAWNDSVWTASIPLQQAHDPLGTTLPAVLEIEGATPGTVRVILQPDAALTFVAGKANDSGGGMFTASFAGLLLLAALGGAILNLMPCVFPVLSLKILSISRHAGDRRLLAQSGVAYTAGVILSFVALAGVLIALRSVGEQLGWGFQLQSPLFVSAMALLFFLIGLNLLGLFEIGTLVPSRVATMQAKHPAMDSFLTGILAVAIASPCTAPFMGASIGAAATMPAGQALLLFAALGLGMALPFLIISLAPALAARLPRPGAWMVTFRTVMAFPMFATAVWLVWVLARMTGADGVAALLFLMVALAFALWLWRHADQPRGWHRALRVAAIVLLAGMVWQVRPVLSTIAPVAAADDRWQPWSEAKLSEAAASGRPVFVDFTAAWCLTCQLNKRAVLKTSEVLDTFDRCGVTLLSADWTTQDPAITRALAGFGRNGVPVYALYGPNGGDPVLLDELLTRSDVIEAVQAIGPCKGATV